MKRKVIGVVATGRMTLVAFGSLDGRRWTEVGAFADREPSVYSRSQVRACGVGPRAEQERLARLRAGRTPFDWRRTVG